MMVESKHVHFGETVFLMGGSSWGRAVWIKQESKYFNTIPLHAKHSVWQPASQLLCQTYQDESSIPLHDMVQFIGAVTKISVIETGLTVEQSDLSEGIPHALSAKLAAESRHPQRERHISARLTISLLSHSYDNVERSLITFLTGGEANLWLPFM